MKNTIVVNLFGEQGTGKSNIMAGIFSNLKFIGFLRDKWVDIKGFGINI